MKQIHENSVRVLIYYPSKHGRMYLCADGYFSNDRSQAQECWASQFTAIVRDNPLLQITGSMENVIP